MTWISSAIVDLISFTEQLGNTIVINNTLATVFCGNCNYPPRRQQKQQAHYRQRIEDVAAGAGHGGIVAGVSWIRQDYHHRLPIASLQLSTHLGQLFA